MRFNFLLPALLITSCATHEGPTYDLKQSDVDSTVKSHLNKVDLCFNDAQEKQKEMISGRFVLKWIINSKGEVEDAEVKDSAPQVQEIADCTLGYLKTWKFPALGGDKTAKVEFPFSINIKRRDALKEAP